MMSYKNATHVVKPMMRDGWAVYGVFRASGGLMHVYRDERDAIEKAIELNRMEETT